jgi:LmbE family N-acetylglucosaminyl deacetylase
MKKRILVLAAHLDDEVLGVGGTMAKYAVEGNEVFIHIIRDGIAERHFSGAEKNGNKREYVKGCAIKSAKVLGIPKKNISFGGYSLYEDFTCTHILGRKNVLDHVEEVLERVNPHEIFTLHPGDTHTDHVVVYKATEIATRPISRTIGNIERVLTYEDMSSTDQMFPSPVTAFLPNVYVDITDYLETKLMAFSRYDTEIKGYPHPRSLEKIRAKAEVRGAEINVGAAEAFYLLRQIVR